MKKIFCGVEVALITLLCVAPVTAESIRDELEDELFGGRNPSFFTTRDNRPLLSAEPERFGQSILALGGVGRVVTQALSNEVLSESAVIPVPAGSAGFAYAFNPDLNVFERKSIGLGTIFNERVTTLGKGAFALGATYVRQDFDEFNGKDTSSLRVRRGLFARDPFLGQLIEDDSVRATLDLDVTTNSVAFYAIYGATDWLDLSFLLPVTVIDFRARSTVRVVNGTLREDVPAFFSDSQCTPARAQGGLCEVSDFTIIREGTPFTLTNPRTGGQTQAFSDVVDETRVGVSDLLVRGKARFFESAWGSLGGLTEFTFPTGDKDNFLGDDAFKARILFLYSTPPLFDDRLYFHFNGGGRVTTETSRKDTLEYGSGLDLAVTQQFSLIAELTGFVRVDPQGLPNNFLDAAFGFKANLFRGLIAVASFRIPITDDGLRSDLVYLAGLEYDF
ncbi:MAG: hypothetical protein ACRERD_17165 [Candidatus Binatia bacterium]